MCGMRRVALGLVSAERVVLPSFCCQGARESDRVSAIIIFSLWPLGPGESFLLVVQYFLISLLGRFYPDHVVEFAPFLLYCMPTFRLFLLAPRFLLHSLLLTFTMQYIPALFYIYNSAAYILSASAYISLPYIAFLVSSRFRPD